MIHEVTGDILLSKAEAIAHGVAPNDHFDQGLALELRKRWPAMAKDFRHYCHLTNPKSGTTWAWGGPGVRIVNLLTQDAARTKGGHPGRAKVEHVNHALKGLRKTIEDEGWSSVALPRLATGVGALDWADVEPLIRHHLGDLGIPIYVYTTFHQGMQAEEPVA